MKKKLLILMITFVSTMTPNLASAIAIDVEGYGGGLIDWTGT
jgi:hypothetical protein